MPKWPYKSQNIILCSLFCKCSRSCFRDHQCISFNTWRAQIRGDLHLMWSIQLKWPVSADLSLLCFAGVVRSGRRILANLVTKLFKAGPRFKVSFSLRQIKYKAWKRGKRTRLMRIQPSCLFYSNVDRFTKSGHWSATGKMCSPLLWVCGKPPLSPCFVTSPAVSFPLKWIISRPWNLAICLNKLILAWLARGKYCSPSSC